MPVSEKAAVVRTSASLISGHMACIDCLMWDAGLERPLISFSLLG